MLIRVGFATDPNFVCGNASYTLSEEKRESGSSGLWRFIPVATETLLTANLIYPTSHLTLGANALIVDGHKPNILYRNLKRTHFNFQTDDITVTV